MIFLGEDGVIIEIEPECCIDQAHAVLRLTRVVLSAPSDLDPRAGVRPAEAREHTGPAGPDQIVQFCRELFAERRQ
jgi:hypothetical protein